MSARRAARSARVKPNEVPGRQFEEIREVDPDGRIVVHHRLVDTLGRLLKSGTIDQTMHDAGRDLQAAFIVAQLDPLRALPLLRVPGTGREPELNERQLDARRRVHAALKALGGLSSPAGSCIWHVVGLQRSVREWATRQGWGGQRVDQKEAKGILVAALGMLGKPLPLSLRQEGVVGQVRIEMLLLLRATEQTAMICGRPRSPQKPKAHIATTTAGRGPRADFGLSCLTLRLSNAYAGRSGEWRRRRVRIALERAARKCNDITSLARWGGCDANLGRWSGWSCFAAGVDGRRGRAGCGG